jgi:hypothetical protein
MYKKILVMLLILFEIKLESMIEQKINAAAVYDAAVKHPAYLKNTVKKAQINTESIHPGSIKTSTLFPASLRILALPEDIDTTFFIHPQNPHKIALRADDRLVIWQTTFDQIIRDDIPLQAATDFATWSPDGRFIAIHGEHSKIYQSTIKKAPVTLFHTPHELITAASFSPNSPMLLTANTNIRSCNHAHSESSMVLRLWNIDTHTELCSSPSHESQKPVKFLYDSCKLAFNQDGSRFVVGLFRNQYLKNSQKIVIQLWDLEKTTQGPKIRKLRSTYFIDTPQNILYHLEFNQMSNLVLAHTSAGVALFDAKTLKVLHAYKGHDIITATFNLQGDGLLVVNKRGVMKHYKIGSPYLLQKSSILKGLQYAHGAFSADKKILYLVGGKPNPEQEKFECVSLDNLVVAQFNW